MSIRVVCPNGHELKVKSSQAGMKGLCPTCKAPVQVPRTTEALEDAVLDLLGNGHSHSSAQLSDDFRRVDGSPPPAASTPKKACTRCHREIDLGTHICPHCHTYIANLADFRA